MVVTVVLLMLVTMMAIFSTFTGRGGSFIEFPVS